MRPPGQGEMRAKSTHRLLAGALILLAGAAYAAGTPWDKPAADLAARIAEILGPGPVIFTLHNLSAIPNDQLPAIRRILEDDLKASGISFTSSEGANTVDVTLSENSAGGLWAAQIGEGNDTRVVMVTASSARTSGYPPAQSITLHREVVVRGPDLEWNNVSAGQRSPSQILAATMDGDSLVVLTSDRVAVFSKAGQGWAEQAGAEFSALHAGSRDPRGIVIPSADSAAFTAFAPGVACSGSSQTTASGAMQTWTIQCHRSDDPWSLFQTSDNQWERAFYNAGRDYFTGVVSPSPGAEWPPFYDAGLLPGRPAGTAVLMAATDGKVELAENGQLQPVAGTRDWGSDFAVIASSCGSPVHVIVSSSGDGAGDSLRAFAVLALEAAPVSEPLMLNGAAMGLSTAPDGKSATAIVRTTMQQGGGWDYEVDRVSEACD